MVRFSSAPLLYTHTIDSAFGVARVATVCDPATAAAILDHDMKLLGLCMK